MTLTVRSGALFALLGASLSCATPGPTVSGSLVEMYRLYERNDCAALRNMFERTDFSAVTAEQQAPFDLLMAFCAEREGELLSAKDRYKALIAKAPRGAAAFGASLRLRELERLEKQGTTREELEKRADEARSTPLYRHGAKTIHRDSPVYPPGASAAGVEGSVLLDFEIAPDGSVTDLVILRSDPPFLFDAATLSALRNWRYAASDEKQPRRASVRIPFRMAPPSNSGPLVAERVDLSGLDPSELRGREMLEYTIAAGRGQTALLQAGYLAPIRDWLVFADEHGSIVRYVDEHGRSFADVRVDVYSSEPEQVTIHEVPIPLPSDQDAVWKARVSALTFAKAQHLKGCTDLYSTVVLSSLDPDRAWDVYVLSVPPDGWTIPIGGHYRISISRDPRVPPELRAFADSCSPPAQANDPERLMITGATSSTPTEMYVYLNLRYRRPIGVALPGDQGLWFVESGRMRRAGGGDPR